MSIEAPEMADGQVKTVPAPVRFGPAKGNVIAHPWAEWMLAEWRKAELSGAKPPKFSDVLQRAALYFLNEAE